MMDQEKYKKILLEKFFQKNLGKEERHELEKLALDDPFLFEALQGFTEVEGDHQSDLKRIKSKKLEVKDKKKRRLIPFGIAASLLLLVSISVWTLGSKSDMAANKTFAEAKESKPNNAKAKSQTIETNGAVVENEMEAPIAEISEEMISYEESPNVDNVSKVEKKLKNPVKDQTRKKAESAQSESGQSERGNYNQSILDEIAVVPTPIPSAPAGSSADSIMAKNSPAPKIDAEIAQAEDAVAEEEAELIAEAVVAAAPKDAMKMGEAKAKRSEQSKSFDNGGAVTDNVAVTQKFEAYYASSLNVAFTAKELRNLKKDLVIEFDIVDSAVANFKTTPKQDNEMNVRLLELVKQGLQYLPNNVQGYKIDLTSL